jgi:hypothetical protein
MGTYIYTIRKSTKNIDVDGTFVPVREMLYAYNDIPSFSRHTPGWVEAMHTRAERIFDEAGPCLAYVDGCVYVVTRDSWIDSYDVPGILIGRVERIGNRLHCVAQETTADLAFNSLGYDYDEATGQATKQRATA